MIEALQHDPRSLGVPAVNGEPITFQPPSDVLPSVLDADEPLVALGDDVQCLNLYRVDGWPGTVPRTYARVAVAERLGRAATLIPGHFSLAIFDAWRSKETVRALYDAFYGQGSSLAPGFLADPDDPEQIPPHTTGGAVDLTLAYRGHPLKLGSYFDDFSPRSRLTALERAGPSAEPARSLRRLLFSVMTAAGFVGLFDEWWHYSYGDQQWARQKQQPCAFYGPTEPAGRA